jgi:hypothetical protein
MSKSENLLSLPNCQLHKRYTLFKLHNIYSLTSIQTGIPFRVWFSWSFNFYIYPNSYPLLIYGMSEKWFSAMIFSIVDDIWDLEILFWQNYQLMSLTRPSLSPSLFVVFESLSFAIVFELRFWWLWIRGGNCKCLRFTF